MEPMRGFVVFGRPSARVDARVQIHAPTEISPRPPEAASTIPDCHVLVTLAGLPAGAASICGFPRLFAIRAPIELTTRSGIVNRPPRQNRRNCGRKLLILNDIGAGGRTRTDDLLITNQLLYQLSYAGQA